MSSTETQASAQPSPEFVALMASLISIVAISIDALLPALGLVARDLNLANPNHAQYLIGFIFAGMAGGQLLAGPLSDALGRKKILYIGVTFYLLGSLVCYFGPTLDVILAGRLIQGIGVAGPYICSTSIVRDRYAGRHMARVMSIVMMIFIMVPALAPSLGQAIIHAASWRAIFLLYIVYAIIIMVWLSLRLPETLPPERRIPFTGKNLFHGLKEVTRNRLTICYTLCMGLFFGSFFGYLNSSQQIFQDQFGVGEMFTVYFGVLALVLGVASLLNSRLVEKLGMHYICSRSFITIIVISIAFLALHFVIPKIELWMFMLYAGLMFFNFGLIFGNLNALAMEPMGHIAGMASAIIGCTSSILSMVLGSFIGQLYDGTLIPMTGGFVALGIVAFGLMMYADTSRSAAGKADL